MNVAPVSVAGSRARLGEREIPLGRAYDKLPVGAKAELGVRPEFIRVSSGGRGMPGRVVRVDDVGRYRVVKLDLDGHLFNAIADEGAEIADDRASVVFDPPHVHIYADGRLVAGLPLGIGAG
jgi:glycerol transport system ATP-binding protein